MRQIFKNNLQLGLFIAALVMTLLTGFLAAANSSISKDWCNQDYEDYVKSPDFYSVTEVPIKEFRTYTGFNYDPISIGEFYRVCLVDITFAGGQTMTFSVSRDADDKVGDMIKVAYAKHWDTDYNKVFHGSDIDENSILTAARTETVQDILYTRVFTAMAIVSALMAAVVFFICYKKKDAYEL